MQYATVKVVLTPVTESIQSMATANRESSARLNVVARDFWGRNRQRAFLILERVLEYLTHLHAPILVLHCLDAMLWMSKKSVVLMMSVFVGWRELVSVSPLVFSASGAWIHQPLQFRVSVGIVRQKELWDSTSFVQIHNIVIMLSLFPRGCHAARTYRRLIWGRGQSLDLTKIHLDHWLIA